MYGSFHRHPARSIVFYSSHRDSLLQWVAEVNMPYLYLKALWRVLGYTSLF